MLHYGQKEWPSRLLHCVGSHVDSDIPEKNAASLLPGKLPRFRCKDFHQSEPEGTDLLPGQQNLKLLRQLG